MEGLRRWQLQASQSFSLPLAADARLHATDYTDDQVWQLAPGGDSSPALALQTNYGGRVGLVTLLPMWTQANRVIYETQAYTRPPIIIGFAPGFLRLRATLLPDVELQADYHAFDSHTIGGQFSLHNSGAEPVKLRLDLFGHVGAQGREQPLRLVPYGDHHALHLGQFSNINPVVVLADGQAQLVDGEAVSPKIGREITVEAGKKAVLRWVHAGRSTIPESLEQAQHQLQADWQLHMRQIQEAARAIPRIETGDNALESTLASAFQTLTLAFIRATGSLPQASFVNQRHPGTGYSPQRDGSDYPREWSGQSPILAYLTGLGIANINPQLAQGLILNYLAVQQADGWIDGQPGLGGQRQGVLCMPILARLAWGIFQYTEDAKFIQAVLPGLYRYFERWLACDVDGDGLPEWQHEIQTGYVYWPTFGGVQAWGEHTQPATLETPDLLAYLLSEAISLKAMAYFLHDHDLEQKLQQHIEHLQAALEQLWNGERYTYRDRDTHQTQAGTTLLTAGRGDEEHYLATSLDPPSRLNLLIEGGVDHTPRFALRLTGVNAEGQPIEVLTDQNSFVWQHNRGFFTTEQVFTQVDLLYCDGLSRVYDIAVTTPATDRYDLNALLPLWSIALPPEHVDKMIADLTNPDLFWRPNGVTMCSALDVDFDAANAKGAGGVWPFWLTLIGEGLIEAGRYELATELVQRLLTTQVKVLHEQGQFHQFYHSDQPAGLGLAGHLSGIVPVYLLLRVWGVRIISGTKVWTGGPYHWPHAISVQQHGVTIRRSRSGTQVTFASGQRVQLPADAAWQEIVDSGSAGQSS